MLPHFCNLQNYPFLFALLNKNIFDQIHKLAVRQDVLPRKAHPCTLVCINLYAHASQKFNMQASPHTLNQLLQVSIFTASLISVGQ